MIIGEHKLIIIKAFYRMTNRNVCVSWFIKSITDHSSRTFINSRLLKVIDESQTMIHIELLRTRDTLY